MGWSQWTWLGLTQRWSLLMTWTFWDDPMIRMAPRIFVFPLRIITFRMLVKNRAVLPEFIPTSLRSSVEMKLSLLAINKVNSSWKMFEDECKPSKRNSRITWVLSLTDIQARLYLVTAKWFRSQTFTTGKPRYGLRATTIWVLCHTVIQSYDHFSRQCFP